MNIRYQREISHNYMIIEAPDPSAAEGFESRMLSENAVPGILQFQVRRREETVEYYYEITSRQPLDRILDTRRIRAREICAIVGGILQAMAGLREYLLREEQLYLETGAIYADPDTYAIGLCLIPGYRCDIPEAMTRLLRNLLEKTDHQEAEGVMIAYNLYETSLKENYGAEDLRKCLEYGRRASGKQEEQPEPAPRAAADREAYPGSRSISGSRGISGSAPAERETGGPPRRPAAPRPADPRKIVKGAVPAVIGALVLLWYIAGLRAAVAGAGGILCLAAAGLVLHAAGSRRKPGETAGPAVKEAPPYTAPPARESSFRIQPESREEFREREEKEEEDRIRRGFTEGTVLLSDLPEEGSADARLEAPDGRGEVIRITYTPFVIGQHPELTDYCVAHAGVSRLHARIDREGDLYRITDLNSMNGTMVNGRKLEANGTSEIRDGDRVCLANLEYRFRVSAGRSTSDQV